MEYIPGNIDHGITLWYCTSYNAMKKKHKTPEVEENKFGTSFVQVHLFFLSIALCPLFNSDLELSGKIFTTEYKTRGGFRRDRCKQALKRVAPFTSQAPPVRGYMMRELRTSVEKTTTTNVT